MEYEWPMAVLMFPSGLSYMFIGQSMSLSKSLGVCKSQYQGRGPENCKNTKFVTLLESGNS